MDLEIGRKPGKLTLRYLLGDPWAADLTLGTEWPDAPVIEFPSLDISWASTLSVDELTASWSKTEAEIDALDLASAKDSTSVRLSVNGVTWWKGVTLRDE